MINMEQDSSVQNSLEQERRGEERTEEENRIGCNIMRYKMTR